MNASQRLNFRSVTKIAVDKILVRETWKERFDAIAGTCQAICELAADCSLDPRKAVEEFGGEVARQTVDRLNTPPIGETHQALFYMVSRDLAHRDASCDWQCRHQNEMAAFSREIIEALGRACR